MPHPVNVPDPGTTAWGQVNIYAEKLFDALEALDEAGGSVKVSRLQGWKPKARDAALARLKATRASLDIEIARLSVKVRTKQPS